eukprot:CAMPEP_0113667954 /NCGR_PEP_ID=MMETSP0038_2-20120614/3730_1 /TAXON_ID=2898 /ORGANISM="Cryptomonas paramecium" /LENGTH=169 /DNA_ID=CAMNT_0000583641 /DNA_START=8 /DNA_END=513 /DNA_ORIENTATION=- /assembly_acc=CAM_ASM_000170
MSAENARVRVVVRLRPPAETSTDPQETIKIFPEQPGLLNIRTRANDDSEFTEREFIFDGVEGVGTSQTDVFEHNCQPQVDHVLEGYNACVFAYGQTGSGKTYSIFGEDGENRGIIPRALDYLFTSIRRPQHAAKKYAVFVSFLEVRGSSAAGSLVAPKQINMHMLFTCG